MLDVFHRYPFCRLLLPFLMGIIVAYYSVIGVSCRWYIPVCFLLVTLLIFCFPGKLNIYSRRWMFGCSLTGLCFFSAWWLTNKKLAELEWQIPTVATVYHAKLIEEPVPKAKSLMCRVYLPEAGQEAIVYLQPDSNSWLKAGDWLALNALFKAPANFTPDFDYASHLKKRGITAIAYVNNTHWKKTHPIRGILPDFKIIALRCRTHLIQQLQIIIPNPHHYSVATALLLGYKDNMDMELKRLFAATGAAHILAVSGLHVSIIYAILYGLLSFVGTGKKANRIRHLAILPIMWIFAFITGLPPSVIRATLMLSVASIGFVLGEKSLSLNTLSASALFMLLYNPLYLWDVGFQLSYSAVAAIVIINPLLKNVYRSDNRIIQYGWDLITVSTSAQLGTFPLSLYYFHQFPTLFLLTNLFIIPLSGILLGTLLGTVLLDLILPLPVIFYFPVNQLLLCFVSGIKRIGEIQGALIEGIYISEFTVLTIYGILCLLLLTVSYKRIIYVYAAALLVIFQVIYYL